MSGQICFLRMIMVAQSLSGQYRNYHYFQWQHAACGCRLLFSSFDAQLMNTANTKWSTFIRTRYKNRHHRCQWCKNWMSHWFLVLSPSLNVDLAQFGLGPIKPNPQGSSLCRIDRHTAWSVVLTSEFNGLDIWGILNDSHIPWSLFQCLFCRFAVNLAHEEKEINCCFGIISQYTWLCEPCLHNK